MAIYKPTIITKKGYEVIQNVINGEQTFDITKVCLGDGQAKAEDISNLTNLVSQKIQATITDVSKNDDGSTSVHCIFDNTNIKESIFLNEIGIFVRGKDDKDVLYSYSTADGNGDYFGAGETVLQEKIDIRIYTSTIDTINATLEAQTHAKEIGTDIVGYENKSLETLVGDMKIEISKIPVYDIIIKTQEAFDELISSSTWLDAKSVALVGDFTSYKTLTVPSNVLEITGFNDCAIDFGTLGGALFNGYSSSIKCVITGITVKGDIVTGSASTVGFQHLNNLNNCVAKNNGIKACRGFVLCTTLNNCIANNNGNESTTYGFDRCKNLTNCVANNTNKISEGNSMGFVTCTNLNNCTANNIGESVSYVTVGFSGCNNLTNCTSNAINNNDIAGHSYGFSSCNDLINCIANNTNLGGGPNYGFYDCNNLTNCTANNRGSSTSGSNSGFRFCNNLTNCNANNAGIGDNIISYGFYTCGNLTNCTTNNSSSGSGHGFYYCKYINGARKGASFTGTLWSGTTTKRDDATCDLS